MNTRNLCSAVTIGFCDNSEPQLQKLKTLGKSDRGVYFVLFN